VISVVRWLDRLLVVRDSRLFDFPVDYFEIDGFCEKVVFPSLTNTNKAGRQDGVTSIRTHFARPNCLNFGQSVPIYRGDYLATGSWTEADKLPFGYLFCWNQLGTPW